jgi:tol-pal system protein YbgF
MIKTRSHILAASLICLLPWVSYAYAPVVEESDNFATFDKNQAADDRPLAHDNNQPSRHQQNKYDYDYADEQPLAHESSHASTNNNASLIAQVLSLQKEVQELRGLVEVQAHELKLLKEQQITFYKDLDARLHNTNPAASSQPIITPPPAKAASPTVSHPGENKPVSATSAPLEASHSNNPAEEQIHYLAAYDLVKSKRFNEAITAMQAFVTQYPKGGYTANAYYWLGELYMTQKNYASAITDFDIVLQQFPSSSKAAPSMLKIAYALIAAGKKQEAITHLRQVIKNYPDTNTAQLAEEKLKSLGAKR